MALTAGTRLGHYEIGALIGAGGMGEVYQARDPRLNRTVAIKVLQADLSAEPQARARFEREAKTIAGLNHPHIATLHDVGRHDQTDFLVMELVEGESLAQALTRGPLPLDRALTCAIEIAGALDQAHRHGVVHRDLKPGNIMLTRSGVKLLDFGLAKLRAGVAGVPVAATETEVSSAGMILGTLQYMAPEQLEGADADARTDIFAFGAVLYEMVTGKLAFEGGSRASLMGAILRDTPAPASSVQRVAPAALDRVIATCLAKDPDDRWQSVRDAGRELKWIAGGSSSTAGMPVMTQAAGGSKRPAPIVVTTAIALVVGLVGAAGAWALKPGARAVERPAIARLAITLPAGHQIGDQQSPPLALSPDGQTLVYSSLHDGTVQLYVRSLDATDARPLIGTEGASMPFFSPDGKSVGFFADGNLKRVSLTGSAPQTICPASVGVGGTWAPDDTIYFVPFNMAGLWKVAATGGTPQPATTLNRADGEVSHRMPHILPGGKALLFTVWTGPGSDERHVHILRLDSGERHLLLRGASTGVYVASGHILYSRDDAMMAVPFDVATGQLGQPVALGERVLDDEGAHFTVSDSGTLVYVPVGARRFERRLVWVTPQGHVEPLAAPVRPYTDPMISPDGRFAVFTNIGPVETLWIHDLSRGTQTSLTTTALGTSQAGTWTSDGKRIVYRGTRLGFRNVFWKAADGSDDEKRLTTNEVMQTPTSAANGTVAIVETAQGTGADIWTLALDSSTPQVFLKTPAAENNARFSPDGRWIAYTSIDAGSRDVYVRPFPGPGGRLPVSNNGGWEPVWSRDGHELYFRRGDAMLSVRITTTPTLTASAPRVVFEGTYLRSDTGGAGYDVAADGRFLMVQPVEPEGVPATSFNVVLNWFDELKRRVPAPKP